jgi:hypothetical protein
MSKNTIGKILEDLERDNPYQSALMISLSALARHALIASRANIHQADWLREQMILVRDACEHRDDLLTQYAYEDLAHHTYSAVRRDKAVIYGKKHGYFTYARPGGKQTLSMTELPLGIHPLTVVKHVSRRDLFPRNVTNIPRLFRSTQLSDISADEKFDANRSIEEVGVLLHTFAREVLTLVGVKVPESTNSTQ